MSESVKDVFRTFNQHAAFSAPESPEPWQEWPSVFDKGHDGKIDTNVVLKLLQDATRDSNKLQKTVAKAHPGYDLRATSSPPEDSSRGTPKVVERMWEANAKLQRISTLQYSLEFHGTKYIEDNISSLPAILQKAVVAMEMDLHPTGDPRSDGAVENINEEIARASLNAEGDALVATKDTEKLLGNIGIDAKMLSGAIQDAGLKAPIDALKLSQQARSALVHGEKLSRISTVGMNADYYSGTFAVRAWDVQPSEIFGHRARLAFLDKDYDGVLSGQEVQGMLADISRVKNLIIGHKASAYDYQRMQEGSGLNKTQVDEAIAQAKPTRLAQLDALSEACKDLQHNAGEHGIRYMQAEFYSLSVDAQQALLRLVDHAVESGQRTAFLSDGALSGDEVAKLGTNDIGKRTGFDPDHRAFEESDSAVGNFFRRIAHDAPPSAGRLLATALENDDDKSLHTYLGLQGLDFEAAKKTLGLPD